MATFFLVGGHGQGDPGATGNGYKEYDLARKFNDKLAAHLKKLGANVEIYDKSKDLYQQTRLGNGLYKLNLKNKIIIETHLNALNKKAYGSEVLIQSGMSADKYDNAIINTLKKYFTNRGIKKRNDLLNMSVCSQYGYNYRLIELCFIDNKDDVNKLVKNMDKIAKEMAEAMIGKKVAVNKPLALPAGYKSFGKTRIYQCKTNIVVQSWHGLNTNPQMYKPYFKKGETFKSRGYVDYKDIRWLRVTWKNGTVVGYVPETYLKYIKDGLKKNEAHYYLKDITK